VELSPTSKTAQRGNVELSPTSQTQNQRPLPPARTASTYAKALRQQARKDAVSPNAGRADVGLSINPTTTAAAREGTATKRSHRFSFSKESFLMSPKRIKNMKDRMHRHSTEIAVKSGIKSVKTSVVHELRNAARYLTAALVLTFVVLLQLTVLVIFGPRGLKGMAKHCIFEHFLRFVKQIRPKPSVVVTLHSL
jgi:hypothetical protein